MEKLTSPSRFARATSVVFRKTSGPFGGLSNMAPGFPLVVNGHLVRNSEVLYQASRFPHRPDIQRLVLAQASPMTAKMKARRHAPDTRADWFDVRVEVMRWCLRLKLAQNWESFSLLLIATGERPIVEESGKDGFWGARAVDRHVLVGVNMLGRLLSNLRDELEARGRTEFQSVTPPIIPDVCLLGDLVAEWAHERASEVDEERPIAPDLYQGGLFE